MSWEMQLSATLLEELYKWIDSLPLSRPKKRIERDFSDGVLVAEIINYYLPDLIDLHNYSSANSLDHKKTNWGTLNKKVLSNFGLDLSDVIINGLSNCKPGLMEVLLFNLRLKIDEEFELQNKKHQQSFGPPSRHTSLSLLNTTSSNKTANLNKNVSRLDYEEVKQQYLEQEEQIEVLQAKLRRLEHVLQLKDMRIKHLSSNLQTDQSNKPTHTKKK